MNNLKTIAIIGSGISGLTAAHLLHKKYDIHVFEKNNRIGGHTNTITVEEDHQSIAIDTGFIVYNDHTYPNFIRLLKAIGVKGQQSNMSFSYSSHTGSLEYSGDTVNTLFAQRKNVFKPSFYALLNQILTFNRCARRFLHNTNNLTLNEFLDHHKISRACRDHYIYPLASAIWSTPMINVGDMPARFIILFYHHHGLLSVKDRPQWRVIQRGSKSYVDALTQPFYNKIQTNTPVKQIIRHQDAVEVVTENESRSFDAVIMACHSDEALALLADPSPAESNILEKIKYCTNQAILHTDHTQLPREKRAWASWNYRQSGLNQATLTYYMNKLQSLDSETPYCVTLNNPNIPASHIIKTIDYAHPLYDQESVNARKGHAEINHINRTFYVGAYWGNGFHEDGVQSSLKALAQLGVQL